MYNQGYFDALNQMSVDFEKVAIRRQLQSAKRLFRGKPKPALPKPKGNISDAATQQSLDTLRASQQHPSTFKGFSPSQAPAPAPKGPTRIDQFESKFRNQMPPTPQTAQQSAAAFQQARPAKPTPEFKRPQTAAPGEVPAAPPGGKAPAPAPTEKPKKGLLAGRGKKILRWGLPAAALGGGAYAMQQGMGSPQREMQMEVPHHYYSDYPSAIPMY